MRGFLTHHDKNRSTTQVTIGLTRRRVWSIRTSAIFPPAEEVQMEEGTEMSLSSEEAI